MNIELRLGASIHEAYVNNAGLPNRCSHPWEYCYIDYAGNVGYCDHLIGHSALMLGNLASSTFDEIWNGSKFLELRTLHVNARKGGTDELNSLFPHCNWCYQRRYVDFEDETNIEANARLISTNSTHDLMPETEGFINRTDFMGGR